MATRLRLGLGLSWVPLTSVKRALRWAGLVVLTGLIGLGLASAWNHAARWISPPPPPIAYQIDALVSAEAGRGLSLGYQGSARFHPGRELSWMFVFEHMQNPRGTPYSEFQIYDILNGRLRLTFDYTPLASTRFMEWPWGF